MFHAIARRIWGLDLVARFTIMAAVVGVLVAGALAWFLESRLTALVLDEVAQDAIDQMNLGVLERVTEADFEPPYTPEQFADLEVRLAPVLAHVREARSSVIRLHLFARDGTVIFSDLPGKRGQLVPPSRVPLLAEALEGRVVKEISGLNSIENADLRARYGSAMEVYVPFVLGGRVVGAYEIYQNLDRIRPVGPAVWGVVFGGFTILFLSLLLVVRGAALQIRRHQAERERLVQQAAEAEALREVSRMKDELMGVVTHELRTPLVTVIGYADMLLTRDYPEPERRRFLTVISGQGRRLALLINDFLDLHRMESGRPMVQAVPADPRVLLEQAVGAAGEDPARPILLEVGEGIPPVLADGDRVQQVLGNLLSNARKYSPEGGEVCLSACRVGDAVEVAVRDHGLGLPATALPHLFERFYRVEGVERRAIRGTGLGLAICRKIVELHGGRIWAESEGAGKGSVFRFTLPLAEAEVARGARPAQEPPPPPSAMAGAA